MKKKKRKNLISFTKPQIEEIVKEEPIVEKTYRNLISIIIPACNRAKNTKNLLDELLFQKEQYYPETEIIVVENNSTEDMSFLDEYKNIVVKHEEMASLSHARNVGLDISCGKYVAFIDNDDTIDRSYLHQLYVTMRSTDCDWCLMSHCVDTHVVTYKEVPAEPLKIEWGCPFYCFNRRIIGDKRFDEKLNVGEDLEWMPRVITPDTKGTIIQRPIYTYKWNDNEDSLSHKFNRGEITREKE